MELQEQSRLHIQQKTSWSLHRYRVYLDQAGKPGDLVAYVDEDKNSFKDKGSIYVDEEKSQVLAEYRAHKLVDMSSAFDVVNESGAKIGSFRKEFKKSLYRSTWVLEQEGMAPISVVERNKTIAGMRRAWTLIPGAGEFPFPMRYHFDFLRDGKVVGGVEKTGRLADNYLAWTDDAKLDRRLLIAMGVALDFRQGR
jgi:hypothetical protein